MNETADQPTLFVCHGDEGGPRFHPCRRVQEALRAAGIPYKKEVAAHGSPIPFLRRGSREELRARTGDTKLPALLLPDGRVLRHSREILAWVEEQGSAGRPTNHSIPAGPVIPVLAYTDVGAAVAWLVDVLGFVERVRIGDGHRAQLSFGAGSLVVADTSGGRVAPGARGTSQSVMLRVEGLDALWARALAAGAEAVAEPRDMPFGERQCSFRDPGAHLWTLSETLRDTRPEEWGGVTVG